MVLDVAKVQGVNLGIFRANEEGCVSGELNVAEWPCIQSLLVVVSINQAGSLVHNGLVLDLEGHGDLEKFIDHFGSADPLNVYLFCH